MSTVHRIVGTHAIPEAVRARCSLPSVDYADAFTLTTATQTTPERWARAMFGDAPSLAETLIWRGLLGLRLAAGRSPATVAGWRIGEAGEDWIRLEAASWWISGNLVVLTGEGRVALGTLLHYEQNVGRILWPTLSALHRRLMPGVLRDAAVRAAAGLTNQG